MCCFVILVSWLSKVFLCCVVVKVVFISLLVVLLRFIFLSLFCVLRMMVSRFEKLCVKLLVICVVNL